MNNLTNFQLLTVPVGFVFECVQRCANDLMAVQMQKEAEKEDNVNFISKHLFYKTTVFYTGYLGLQSGTGHQQL